MTHRRRQGRPPELDLVRPPYRQVPQPAMVRSERRGDRLITQLSGMTNRELRDVIAGLVNVLPEDEARDCLRECGHYLDDPGALLSPIADAVANARIHERATWLRDVKNRE